MLKQTVIYLMVLFTIVSDAMSASNTTNERTGKWSLFNFIQLNKEPCEGNGSQLGVCLSSKACTRRSGGQSIGTCAQGFGVCCFITKTCGEAITENSTYFVNPGYPSAATQLGLCSVEIVKSSNNICQLRLDLEEFSMAGIDALRGRCADDSMLIVGRDSNNFVPAICGSNSGQHLFVEVGSSSGPFNLMVTTSTSITNVDRIWKIRVTQIECNNPGKAPAMCLQYHTGNVGIIKSFNQEISPESERSSPLHYAICIRKEVGMCAAAFVGEFVSVFPEDAAGCSQEYLAIGATEHCANKTFDKELQTSGWGPIVATFKGEVNRIGFNLRYSQIPC